MLDRKIETILRNKIFNEQYWSVNLFSLTSETILDEIVKLSYIGGTYSDMKRPTKFIMIILKLLTIRPSKDIIYEYIMNDDFKYLRAIGAFYLRLTGDPVEIYQFIEPLYYDYRKLRIRTDTHVYETITMDQFAWNLLHNSYYFDIALERIPIRPVLESQGLLPRRESELTEGMDENQIIELVKSVELD